MYSQNNEEEIILKKFGDKVGTFLDIGAYDGVNLSNTRRLAELGWNGVLVEGSSFNFGKLFHQYKSNSKMTLINSMVAYQDEVPERVVKMWESPNSAISTMEKQNYEKWKVAVTYYNPEPFYEMFVSVSSLREILNVCKSKHPIIDFVNIDVEGTSTDIGLKFDPDEFQTSMVCIEHDGRVQELMDYYSSKGFVLNGMNAENLIFSR